MWARLGLFMGVNAIILLVVLLVVFKYPEFKSVGSFRVVAIDNGEVRAESEVFVYNPNFFRISGSDITMQCAYNDVVFGTGKIDQLSLPSKEIGQVNTYFTFETEKLARFWEDLIAVDSLPVDVGVGGSFTWLGIKQSMDVTMYFSGAEMIDMVLTDFIGNRGTKFKKLRLKKAGIAAWKWSFIIEIENTLPGNFTIKELNASIYSSDNAKVALGEYRNTSEVFVMAGKKADVPGAMSISSAGLFTGAIDKLKDPNLILHMDGEVIVALEDAFFTIPVKRRVKFNPLKGSIVMLEP